MSSQRTDLSCNSKSLVASASPKNCQIKQPVKLEITTENNNSLEADDQDHDLKQDNTFSLMEKERLERQAELDSRSIFVANIMKDTTPELLEAHFGAAGNIKRITISHNNKTDNSKGYAYIEFESKSSLDDALALSGSEFNGTRIRVSKKRTNIPGYYKLRQKSKPNTNTILYRVQGSHYE